VLPPPQRKNKVTATANLQLQRRGVSGSTGGWGGNAGELSGVGDEDDEYELSGQIKAALRAIPWPDGFPLRDRLEMAGQALTALFDEERRKRAVTDFEELLKRPSGLEAFEELIRDFKSRKVELRTVFRQPQR
jgi:hypothetical protein